MLLSLICHSKPLTFEKQILTIRKKPKLPQKSSFGVSGGRARGRAGGRAVGRAVGRSGGRAGGCILQDSREMSQGPLGPPQGDREILFLAAPNTWFCLCFACLELAWMLDRLARLAGHWLDAGLQMFADSLADPCSIGKDTS